MLNKLYVMVTEIHCTSDGANVSCNIAVSAFTKYLGSHGMLCQFLLQLFL